MDYNDYATRFSGYRGIANLRLRAVATLDEGADSYPLLFAELGGTRTVTITAGFHGDEVAGPLTLLEYLPDIVAYARERDVGLRIYPCLNPSGFTDATRYNRSAEAPNNDFLRYEIAAGQWAGELKPGQKFLRFDLHRAGPKETRALMADLQLFDAPDAALDIHQDPWLEGARSYAYTFGAREAYLPLVADSDRFVPVARDLVVDDEDDVRTDADGLIELHDGSVTDYFLRQGVPFTAALETTTRTPMPLAHEVNLIWIRGFIDLAARR